MAVTSNPQPNSPQPDLEDIFSSVGDAAPATNPLDPLGAYQTNTPPLPTATTEAPVYEPPVSSRARISSPRRRMLIIIGIVVLVLVLLGGTVWGLFTWLTQPSSEVVEETPIIPTTVIDDTTPIFTIDESTDDTTSSGGTFIDTDHDGLSDQQEIEVNTNPKKTDTDEDGLKDREEVIVYGTDPRNPDTDGDGFLDGAEVSNFYDPNDADPNKRLYDISAN